MGLIQEIKNNKFHLGIVGMGYVGLPLAVEFAKAGIAVTGIDLDKERVKRLNRGERLIMDIPEGAIEQVVESGMFKATADYSVISKQNVVIICVPTPLTINKEPDLTAIISASREIAKYLKKGTLVVLESTTFPGTTEEYVMPILEEKGLKAGKDFHIAFSPERIDPGNRKYSVKNTPKVVGGLTKECTEITKAVYEKVVERIVPVSSPRVAEMTKLLENIFRNINIGLVNELTLLCDRMDIDVWEVVESASTKPFGFMPFLPGPGVGGHCIPLDPFYLAWKAREYDFYTNFITLSGQVNDSMPYFVVTKLIRSLVNAGIKVKNAKVLALGVAFKKDIEDVRNSPSVKIIRLLEKSNIRVIYNDPYVPEVDYEGVKMKSMKLTDKLIKSADCVLILTDHSCYKYDEIVKKAKLVFDTRNCTKSVTQGRSKIVKL